MQEKKTLEKNQEKVQMTAQKVSEFSFEVWGRIQTNGWRIDMQKKVLNWANGAQHKEDTVTWQMTEIAFNLL